MRKKVSLNDLIVNLKILNITGVSQIITSHETTTTTTINAFNVINIINMIPTMTTIYLSYLNQKIFFIQQNSLNLEYSNSLNTQ